MSNFFLSIFSIFQRKIRFPLAGFRQPCSYHLQQDSVPKVLHLQLFYLYALLKIEQLMMQYLRFKILVDPVFLTVVIFFWTAITKRKRGKRFYFKKQNSFENKAFFRQSSYWFILLSVFYDCNKVQEWRTNRPTALNKLWINYQQSLMDGLMGGL